MVTRVGVVFTLTMIFVLSTPPAGAAQWSADEAEFRNLYRQLVNINTTRSAGSCTEAAEAMRTRLSAANIPEKYMQILAPPDRPKDGTLIALLPGRELSEKPILLLAHIDVVEAKPEDWQRDPFNLVEDNGMFYGRGSSDDKAMAAIFVDSLIRFSKQGFIPRRGVKLALTCGEETPDVFNSVRWLLETRPETLDAAFALNEGAFGELDTNGKPIALQLQAGEKVYQDFTLSSDDVGGHSARPNRNNPIVRLGAGLAKLGAYNFPVVLNEVTRSYFEAESELVRPDVAADMHAVLTRASDEAAVERLWAASPSWNAALRTTCAVTQITGGHAPNALPEHVRANVNCRILPGVPVAEVQKDIGTVLMDEHISVVPTGVPGLQAPVPPLTEAILAPVREVARKIWPGVAIVPTMLVAATDGRFLNAGGVPTYGLSGIFQDPDGSHAHGVNEHIRVKSLMDARRFLYEVVKRYANSPRKP